MTTTEKAKPPRKPVTAWETETCFEEDEPFVVLTFHHGLGEMTRLDLSAQDVDEVAAMLTAAGIEARSYVE